VELILAGHLHSPPCCRFLISHLEIVTSASNARDFSDRSIVSKLLGELEESFQLVYFRWSLGGAVMIVVEAGQVPLLIALSLQRQFFGC